jgi:D-serine deaminase-like pyridoxal phosphate-dependent protein
MQADAARFERYATALARCGAGVPRLLIDLERLDANVDRTLALIGSRGLRLVVKSLPAAGLLRHIAERAKTRRFSSTSACTAAGSTRSMRSIACSR